VRSSSPNQQRLLHDIQRLLSTLMLRDIADPRFSELTITRMEASGRQLVTVWIYRAGEQDAKACIKALEKMGPHFEHELRRVFSKKRLPRLRFRWDDAFEKSGDVLMLLRNLERP